jgi:rubrerythrin
VNSSGGSEELHALIHVDPVEWFCRGGPLWRPNQEPTKRLPYISPPKGESHGEWRKQGILMHEKNFQEIIQFAIEKEIGTHDLYTMCGQIAKYSGAKELFEELAKEEEGHRKLLENLSIEKVVQAKLEPIPDLGISDYLIEVKCMSDSSYADILRLVMKNEEHSVKLYNDLKESCKDKELKKMFAFLAQEEAKHKLKFEKIYDEEILK